MNAIKNKTYTVEEYLAMNAASEEKWEYHDGHVYAMAGGTPKHSRVSANVIAALTNGLKDQDCVPYTSDAQLHIASQNRYVYPDAMVICGKEEYADDKQLQLTNPILIIEVLSESTKIKDEGEKFNWYKTIPSFKEYVLIESTAVFVKSFYREENDLWKIASAYKLTDSIYLHSLQISLSLKDIYNKIEGVIITENQ